ncbi:MAG: Holliday junction branch migration DNA helicase RuvB, partial [Betaproteobacteria bacterium]|nr:Holliday junction branch migration DNA helicase RuvB [Betaproteobacteria bacterium]
MSIQHDQLSAPRLIAAHTQTPQEEAIERALRPKSLRDYVGQ